MKYLNMNSLEVKASPKIIKAEYSLALMLGWQDVRQAYRRSAIGPFWLTIGMFIQIVTMSVVFSLIFKITLEDYLPFLTASMLIWSLISNAINDGCNALINAESLIKQIKLPLLMYTFRVLWKTLVTFGHNLVILPLVFIFYSNNIGPVMLLAIPGLLLLVANLTWLVALVSLACARFRDMVPIVGSVVTILYFITPIMWQPTSLGNGGLAHLLLGLNPMYHLVQICRQPLIGIAPTAENWVAACFIFGLGWLTTSIAYRKFNKLVAFWV